jgi:DNA-binding XRE family transcriptional regulator
MKTLTSKSLGDLEKGIKQLLLEDRCSFSVDDCALLNDCLDLIDSINSSSVTRLGFRMDSMARLVELMLKLLIAGDHFKQLF